MDRFHSHKPGVNHVSRNTDTIPTYRAHRYTILNMEQTNDFWKLLINGTHIVPLEDKEGAIFVDAYCGIGEYAMDLANEFPSVKVIGIGREFNSPVSKPANCRFVVENVVEGTHIASNSCQFVQSRDTALWLREENWEPYFAELFRILAGNGYIQVLEMDVWRKYPSGEGAGFSQWCNVVYPALASTKGVCVYNLSQRLAEAAQTVGFTDISPLLYEIPVGHWEKRTWGTSK